MLPLLLLALAPLSAQNTPALIETYCSGCHNGQTVIANVHLKALDPAHISAEPELWTQALRHLQAGTMPPAGSPRPDRAGYTRIISSIEQQLKFQPQPELSSSQIATRLAKLLWNTSPDAELLKAAEHDGLRDPAAAERQVRRMLADLRTDAFVNRFFLPWLQLDKLSESNPDIKHFPDYTDALRDAFQRETKLFLLGQLREDRDPLDLWTANYSYLNEQLAKHYGVPNVKGDEFRRVAWPTQERAGLLGQGSILMATSRHNHGPDSMYTTPASRAKWVLFHFYGVETPLPFAGAQPVKPELPITPQTRALPNDPCVTCHRNFFPLGYGLEHFDPIGKLRANDQLGPADATGALVDGTQFNGAAELRAALLQRPDAFRITLVERLLTYAAEKPVKVLDGTPHSYAIARQIAREPKPSWSKLIASIVRTRPID